MNVSSEIEFIDVLPRSAAPTAKRIPLADKSLAIEAKGVENPRHRPIFISRALLSRIVEHSVSDLAHEVGGVLVGGHYDDNGTDFIEIEAFLNADYAEGRAASFKFTHRTWEDITRRVEREHEGKILVGWQHSHPGYGVFLSHHDTFIHENFFNVEWQVALVVDPVSMELGFFQWQNGRIVDCGFYLTDARGARP
jgi:proteasome lid subunit RPN8/RPN11